MGKSLKVHGALVKRRTKSLLEVPASSAERACTVLLQQRKHRNKTICWQSFVSLQVYVSMCSLLSSEELLYSCLCFLWHATM